MPTSPDPLAAAAALLPAQLSGVDPARLFAIVAALVLSLSFHEACHAWAAHRLGDDTAERQGRLTLNPLAHIDLFGTILLPAFLYLTAGFIFGGAKPVPVNPSRFRHPLRGNAIVAICGPLSNFFLALVFLAVFHVVYLSGRWEGKILPQLLVDIARFNVLLAVFNLVPIPPLDGSRVVTWLLPDSIRPAYASVERFGILIIIGLFFLYPPFGNALFRTVVELTQLLYRVVTLGGLW